MKNIISHSSFCFVFILILGSSVFGQTYEEKRQKILDEQTNTRAEINVLDARIKTYEQRINKAENQYDELYRQYENVNRLISLQDDKLESLEQEQNHIQEEIRLTEEELDLRQRELDHLIDNYKQILTYTYKNGRTSNLELLVTSKSINQMIVRSYYLRKLDEQKTKQANQIRVQRLELEDVKSDLKQSHYKNELVLDEIRDEKGKLSDQQTIQRQNVEKIKAESTNLLSELRRIREQKENLENNFTDLIAEEERIREAENDRLNRLAEARNIADAARRAEEVAKYSTPTTTSFVSDETLAAYERNFAVSKGKLNWPVNSKTISKRFGVTRNPLYGTRTDNPGINIVTESASEVRVVSDGQVFAIQPLPGFGNVVFVKHGTYYTAYGNLSQINVVNRQILTSGTVVGRSGTENSELGETLLFIVRKNNTNLNPEEWLSKK